MSENDIKFFPADGTKPKFLGGGYITSGILKTNFSVFRNDKNDYGFMVALPSTRKTSGDGYDNHVEFKNRDASLVVYDFVKPLVATLLGRSGGQSQAQTQAPSRVDIQNNASHVGAPF